MGASWLGFNLVRVCLIRITFCAWFRDVPTQVAINSPYAATNRTTVTAIQRPAVEPHAEDETDLAVPQQPDVEEPEVEEPEVGQPAAWGQDVDLSRTAAWERTVWARASAAEGQDVAPNRTAARERTGWAQAASAAEGQDVAPNRTAAWERTGWAQAFKDRLREEGL